MNRPWMPLYIADYLADTMHLNATDSGAYLHLIMHYWQHGELPRDDRALARIAKIDPRRWHFHRGTVMQFFILVEGGYVRHRRIDYELSRCEELSNKRKHAALQKHNKSSAKAYANALHIDTHSHSHSHKKERKKYIAKCGLPLPKDWIPSEHDRLYARTKGWQEDRITQEGERFRNHSLSKGRIHKNIHAAWCNWVTSPFQTNGNGANGHGGSVSKAAERLITDGGFSFGPRPGGILPAKDEDTLCLLPQGRSERS